MKQNQPVVTNRFKLSTFDLAIAGVFGALAIVLAFTPLLGMIPVPNPTEAATTLHVPAIVAGILSGPVVGGLVGLVLAISSWYLYSAVFMTFADGNLLLALVAAFLPRILIGILAYYAYRSLRRWRALAAGVAGLVGTLANTVGVLGLLMWLGTFPVALLAPVLLMNVPIEIAVAVVVTIPVVAALRATGKGRIAAERS
ncbi:MAG: ECF transporter S component [Chloroflexi bacterium]|nr:ECF transporter S component [Chloroflexota bacterium]